MKRSISAVAILCSILASAHIAWQPSIRPLIEPPSPPTTEPQAIIQIEPLLITVTTTTITSISADITYTSLSPITSTIPPSTIPLSLSASPVTSSASPINAWGSLVSGLVDEIDEHLHIDLRKRQGGVGATAVATTAAVQMPTVTVWSLGQGAPLSTYTQTFVLPLEAWPGIQQGSVGLGSIQGQIGVVKTNSKRATMPKPTGPGQILRIKGRGVTMS